MSARSPIQEAFVRLQIARVMTAQARVALEECAALLEVRARVVNERVVEEDEAEKELERIIARDAEGEEEGVT